MTHGFFQIIAAMLEDIDSLKERYQSLIDIIRKLNEEIEELKNDLSLLQERK